MEITKLLDILKSELSQAFLYTENFHSNIFKYTLDSHDEVHLHVALLYLSQAFTCINSAKLIYTQYSEPGECSEFEDVIHRFKVLNNEFLASYSTNHSLQWTDIEYNNFVKSYETFKQIFG